MKSTKSGGGWAALGRPVTARLGMTPGPVPFSSHVGKADRIEQPDHPASYDAGPSLCRIYLDSQPVQNHCCCGSDKREKETGLLIPQQLTRLGLTLCLASAKPLTSSRRTTLH